MVTGWLSDFLKYEVIQGRVNFLFPGGVKIFVRFVQSLATFERTFDSCDSVYSCSLFNIRRWETSLSNGSNREPFAAITDVLKNSRLSMMKVSTCFSPPTSSSRHSMSD